MTILTAKIKSTIFYKRLRKWEHDLRKYIKYFSLNGKLYKAPPVFIYQMGKAASPSTHHPLKKQYSGAVAHTDHIDPDNLAAEMFHERYKQGHQIKTISSARGPIAFIISLFFQYFENITGHTTNTRLKTLSSCF